MKNVSKPLAFGYFNLFNNIIVDGHTVTFHYLKAPKTAVSPYVVLTSMYSHNNNTRTGFDCETTVDVNIYTEFPGDFGSMNLADDIADRMLEILIPQPGVTPLQAEGFNVTVTRLLGMRDYESTYNNKSLYEKRMTFEHLIYQN